MMSRRSPLSMATLVSSLSFEFSTFALLGFHTPSITSYSKSINAFTPLLPIRDEVASLKGGREWFLSEGSMLTLPFDCTGCGKCCKVKGTVVMSPKEVLAAANLLNISVSDFKNLYVEEEQNLKMNRGTERKGDTEGSEQGWVKLRDQGKSKIATIESGPTSLSACIFLDENNKCKIYEARPMQCLSYPFWPNIMASRQTWDEEVTLPGDPPETQGESTTSKSGKYWNPQDGGCEGMSKIADASEADGSGVPIEEAYVTLEFYKRYRKSFPWEADFKPVN